MAHYCYAIILSIVLLIILNVQAAPATNQDDTPNPISDVEGAFKKLADSVSDGLKNIWSDPNVGDFVKEGQKLMENLAQNIQSEAAKLIPKTEGLQLETGL